MKIILMLTLMIFVFGFIIPNLEFSFSMPYMSYEKYTEIRNLERGPLYVILIIFVLCIPVYLYWRFTRKPSAKNKVIRGKEFTVIDRNQRFSLEDKVMIYDKYDSPDNGINIDLIKIFNYGMTLTGIVPHDVGLGNYFVIVHSTKHGIFYPNYCFEVICDER